MAASKTSKSSAAKRSGAASAAPTSKSAGSGGQPRHDLLAEARQRVKAQPYNIDAWLSLIQLTQRPSVVQTGGSNAAREQRQATRAAVISVYEEILTRFPCSERVWIAYLDYAVQTQDDAKIESKDEGPDASKGAAEALFKRCLIAVPSLVIWRRYYQYIQAMFQKKKPSPTMVRQTMHEFYQFSLDQIGYDIDSAPLWSDYLEFLHALPTQSPYEEQMRMTKLRDVYARALTIPLQNLEGIWSHYDSFEKQLNLTTAKKMTAERSGGYMLARGHLTTLEALYQPIRAIKERHNQGKGWYPVPPTWTSAERECLAAWRQVIRWERENPLELTDMAMLQGRVVYAFKSALTMLTHYPEMWVDYAAYLHSVGRTGEAGHVFLQGIQFLPSSLTLTFTYAEQLEGTLVNSVKAASDGADVLAPYDAIAPHFYTLIGVLEDKIKAIHADMQRKRQSHASQQAQQAKTSAGGAATTAASANADAAAPATGDWNDDRNNAASSRQSAAQAATHRLHAELHKDITLRLLPARQDLTLVWIHLMRVARRMKGMQAARYVFSRARKRSPITLALYTAAALMEFHNQKAPEVARRIFEMGFQRARFGEGNASTASTSLVRNGVAAVSTGEPDPFAFATYDELQAYAAAYLDFTIQRNHEDNTHALFERMITALTPDETTGAAADAKDPALQALLCLRSLWNAYAGHEQAYGDLASLRKIKQRRADALGIGDMSDRAYLNTTRAQAGQWGCFGLDGVARELGMASTTSSSSRRVATTHVGIGIDFADTGLEEDLFDLETKGKRSGDRRIKLVTKAVPADWRDRNRNGRSSRQYEFKVNRSRPTPMPDLSAWHAYDPEPAAPLPGAPSDDPAIAAARLSAEEYARRPDALRVPVAVLETMLTLPPPKTWLPSDPYYRIDGMLQILSELALPTPSAAAGAAATGAPGSSATPPVVLVPYVNLSNPAHALRFARELGLVTPSGAAGVNAPTPATIAPLVASTVPERDPRQQDASAAGSGLEPRSSKRLRNQ